MISSYLNQSADLKIKTGNDEYNDPIFADAVTIKCRFEFKRRMVRDSQRQQVISEARIYTTNQLKPGDVVIYGGVEYPVIAASDNPDLNGTILFYEGAL